jgi:spore maturation protein CgeB
MQQAGLRAEYIPTRLMGRELDDYLDVFCPDYLLYLGTWLPEYAELVRVARQRKIGMIWWATEDPCAHDSTLADCAYHADIILTPAIECVDRYRQHGKTATLFTFGCNPAYHQPGTLRVEYDYDWIAPCSYYADHACRRRGFDTVIRPCVDSPYSGFVSGNHWMTPGAGQYFTKRDVRRNWIPRAEMPDIYASAKINIGLQCDDTSMTQTSMRPFEVLSCGGFLLSQWTPAMDALFEDRVHLLLSRSADETRTILDYYLAHDDDRAQIARQGQAFVREHYTYARMVRDRLIPLLKGHASS